MRMSTALFCRLQNDCLRVCEVQGIAPASVTHIADAWRVFHKVCGDRTYDDTHPGFASGKWTRVLEKQDGHYIDRFYRGSGEGGEDLNDNHIETALRRIFPNAKTKAEREKDASYA